MKLFGITLGEGNGKIGEVLNFSLPSVLTCPGASEWCLKYCYGKRFEIRRPKCRNAYQQNYEIAQDTERFIHIMTGIIPRIIPCFRIHVCGDFGSREYISAWIRICSELPNIHFWTYSRSWRLNSLLPVLEELNKLDNMELFLSTDPTMSLPPKGWRIAFIESDPRANGILCKEQTGEVESCLECGYCFKENRGDVVFKVR